MDIKNADITKLLQRSDQKKYDAHLSAINNYAEFIEQNPQHPDNVEYLFNILRKIGYIKMMGIGAEADDWKDIRELFVKETPDHGTGTPSFIMFDDLMDDLETYLSIQTGLEGPPKLGEGTEEDEEIWDEKWWGIRELALELVFRGFDITAIKDGYQQIKNGTNIRSIEKSWTNFYKKSSEYLEELYKYKDHFHAFSDSVFKQSTAFPFIPDEDFKKFVSEITVHQESHAKENHYQYLISEEDVQEIYYHTKLRFQDKPSAAWIYFYETALAEEMLKEFILSVCFANQTDISGVSEGWELKSTLDENMPDEIPMIRAGGKNYSVHVVSNAETGGWGIRKDRLQKFLSVTDKAFQVQGALFCSMKAYPSGAVVVRFENYMERERLEKLLGQKEEVFRNFVRLSFEEVYEPGDLREGFLRTAAEDVTGLLAQEPAVPDETGAVQKKFPNLSLPAIEAALSEWGDSALQELQSVKQVVAERTAYPFERYAEMLLGFSRPALQGQGEVLRPPEYNVVFVSVTSFKDCVFLDPDSEQKDMNQLLRYVTEEKWSFTAFFLNADGQRVGDSESPEEIEEDEAIQLDDLPEGTQEVFVAIGPENKLDELRKVFAEEPWDNTDAEICWVIYH